MTQQQLQTLIDRIVKKPHSKFRFIVSWADLQYVKNFLHGCKATARMFNYAANRQFKKYLQALNNNQDITEFLFLYCQFRYYAKFYTDEYKIAEDMISEYRCYIFDYRLVKTLLGYTRPDSHLMDWRKLPIKFF